MKKSRKLHPFFFSDILILPGIVRGLYEDCTRTTRTVPCYIYDDD